ncbi:hypothetical protein [Bacillus mycoides]|uniref:hypothetical protein n=1 Tax=Bacillus mycoides TaxID=1405 RepID=UPI001F358B8E|nr:hypothetical protein [Bacillus mycoides]
MIRKVLEKSSDIELMNAYGYLVSELKQRGLIRTNNVVGELAESFVIRYYKEKPGLPNLQSSPIGTQNIDAISIQGKRYAIKGTTSKVTGVFYGLNDPENTTVEEKLFEYVIVVLFSENYGIEAIYELDWDNFLEIKKWHSRMRAWNLPINKDFKRRAKLIYPQI